MAVAAEKASYFIQISKKEIEEPFRRPVHAEPLQPPSVSKPRGAVAMAMAMGDSIDRFLASSAEA